MRILQVSETLIAGGAETFVVRLCNELCKYHEVTLMILHKDLIRQEILQQLNEKVEIIIIPFPLKRAKQKTDSLFYKLGVDYSLVDARFKKYIKKCIDDLNPEVVHTHLFKTDKLLAQLKQENKYHFKHVTTIHGDYSSIFKKEANPRLIGVSKKMLYTLSHLDSVVCICQEHIDFFKTHFANVTSGKLHLIYNGYKPIDDSYKRTTKLALGLPEDSFIFGMVSRGVPKKGWEKAIEAYKKLNLKGTALVLVGWSDYLAQLKQQHGGEQIIFSGFSAMPIEYIQHFDACLLPTLFYYESLPTVVMEYLFCGKPVIATDVGEIRKMLTANNDLQAGHLLAFNNRDVDTGEMAEAMLHIYNGRSESDNMSHVARAAFRKFEMQNCVEKYMQVYGNGKR